MFKKKEELDYENVDTILGKDMDINGSINGKGILRVDGRISGEIVQNGDIIVGEDGIIEANIKARHITVSGTIKGNIDVTGLLQLLPTAKVFGDIKVQNLSIADGAFYKGVCEMVNSNKSEVSKKNEKHEKE